MAKYYEGEAVVKAFTETTNLSELARQILASMKEADVAPVVHAHWVYRGNEHYSLCDWYERFECSRCRRKVKLSSKGEIEDLPYCNCGAKMDEEAKDDETGKAQN